MRRYPTQPWVAIGVVVHKDNDVLLIKRAKEPNLHKWSIPGGAQTVGETVFEGAIREVREETSITIIPKHYIDVIDSIHLDQNKAIQFHYTIIEVSACWVSGTPIPGDDALEARWVSINEIENYKMSEDTIKIIRSSYNKISSSAL